MITDQELLEKCRVPNWQGVAYVRLGHIRKVKTSDCRADVLKLAHDGTVPDTAVIFLTGDRVKVESES